MHYLFCAAINVHLFYLLLKSIPDSRKKWFKFKHSPPVIQLNIACAKFIQYVALNHQYPPQAKKWPINSTVHVNMNFKRMAEF
jgi:hypothetical protein